MARPLADTDEAVTVMRTADLEPLDVYPGAKRPWRSRCTRCNTECAPHLVNVRKGYRGCKTCRTNAKLLPEADCIATMQAAGLEPLLPYPGTNEPWLSQCLGCGDEVSPRLASIKQGNGGCQPCGWTRGGTGRRLSHDEAAASIRVRGFEPLEEYPGDTMKPWRMRCQGCGSEVSPSHNQVSQSRGGCPCGVLGDGTSRSRRLPSRGRRRTAPEARQIMLAGGVTPIVDYPGRASDPWLSTCQKCGGRVSPRLSSIIAGQGGCHPCGRAQAAMKQRIPAMTAETAMLAAGLTPLAPYPGSEEPWPCQCQACGAQAQPSLAKITAGQRGCRACSAVRASAAFREDENAATQSMLDACLTPLTPYPGLARLPWRCQCDSCGRTVYPTLNNIRAGQGGCRNCAWTLNRSGVTAGVYLISNPELNAIKVGIGVVVDGRMPRLRDHTQRGWVAHHQILDLPSASDARFIERTVIQHWRGKGLDAAVTRADMPQWGHTETAPLDRAGITESLAALTTAHRMVATDQAA